MLSRVLLVGFIVIPIVEIVVFMQLGSWLGLIPTLLGILLTALIGVHFIRQQGLQTLMGIQQKLHSGQLPAQEIFTGFVLAIAGVCLITPGFVTDALGFMLLISPVRYHLIRYLLTNVSMRSQFNVHSTPQNSSQQGRTVDGEFTRSEESRIDRQ